MQLNRNGKQFRNSPTLGFERAGCFLHLAYSLVMLTKTLKRFGTVKKIIFWVKTKAEKNPKSGEKKVDKREQETYKIM